MQPLSRAVSVSVIVHVSNIEQRLNLVSAETMETIKVLELCLVEKLDCYEVRTHWHESQVVEGEKRSIPEAESGLSRHDKEVGFETNSKVTVFVKSRFV